LIYVVDVRENYRHLFRGPAETLWTQYPQEICKCCCGWTG